MQNQPKPRTESFSMNEMIFMQLRDLKEEVREMRRELNARMDRIEQRMDRLEGRMDKMDGRMDRMENEIRSTTRHSQIITASCVAIALGVLYFVATH